VSTKDPLTIGQHEIRVFFDYDGGFGAGGTFHLIVNNDQQASGRVEKTVPVMFSMSGETFDVGIDTGAPVGLYPHLYPCTAKINEVVIEVLDELDEETRQAVLNGEFKAGLAAQ
jgi:arylsulfatase